ncbi:FAD-dependent oxidoreductase [Myroides injenensis]|uniref:FAD-dependent oxidoreductase n=1 Tax=Myroides injenensis TaxID=1183151 RepID=UPI00028912E6|nr:NAD(P)/FAD-dependent oxidoreductase [Myroides injenensis]
MNENIAIIGSGLVGVVLAITLKRLGLNVTVYDKSKDIREVDFKGRSINLALSNRGWKILKKIGIEEDIKKMAIPMYQRAIHLNENNITFQPYGINGEAIWAISRGDLNKKLISIAEGLGVNFQFDTPIWDVDLDNGILFTADKESDQWSKIKHDMIFGADGAYSRIRSRMQRQSRYEYQQSYLKLGYKEFVIRADDSGKHRIDANSFHIWPRKDFMFIALANVDGSFTCTLFMPFEGDVSFENITSDKDIITFFEKYFIEVTHLIPDYVTIYKENPVNSLVTMKCFPWVYKDKVALIGDAAHAVVPFYGQGLNAGLEDVFVLSEIIDKNKGTDWGTLLQEYQKERKPNGDAIAELSYRNFKEMSESTADEEFLIRKKIESSFAIKYPDLWLPLYDRVTFSNDSYLSALKLGDFQNGIMDEVMKIEGIYEKWSSEEVENKIKNLIKEAQQPYIKEK